MNAPFSFHLLRLRVVIVSAALALTVLGVLFVHSTMNPGAPFPQAAARDQALKAVFAFAAFLLVAHLDYRRLEQYAPAIYGALIVVLAMMLVVRLVSGELLRAISFPLFQVQPSELMKIALVLFLARYLRYREDHGTLRGLLLPIVLTVVPMGLVLLQPDLGTSLVFPPTLLGMLFVAGARRKHLLMALLLGPTLLAGALLVGERLPLLADYQRARLTAFWSRDEVTKRNDGFQLEQSLIAVGSGGLDGRGYMKGAQNRLNYLPEKHTDFIFSVVAEELGFIGAASTVFVYAVLLGGILRVAFLTREPFGRLVATGVGTGLAVQTLENLCMTLGLTPITGLPLPFVSWGGSSLVTSFLSIGVVVAVSRRPVRVVASRDLVPETRQRAVPVEDSRSPGLLDRRWPTV